MSIPNHHSDPAPPAELPELSDASIDRIEQGVFAEISQQREKRRVRRTRTLVGVGAAAAVLVVAAFISPAVLSIVNGGSMSTAESVPEVAPATDGGGPWGGVIGDGDASGSEEAAVGGSGTSGGSDVDLGASATRDIITNGSMQLRADDVPAAAQSIQAIANDLGGYVESMNVEGPTGTSRSVVGDGVVGVHPEPGMVIMPPYPAQGAWVQIRVPADSLDEAMDRVGDLGEASNSQVNRQDVTQHAVDLRAQVAAAEASVARLTELMGEAGSLSDLIAAESALAERQVSLDSYRQQLEMLDDQVAMSSLHVSITPRIDPVEANPAGFGDGLAAGWNGLIATLNGIVVALGFLLPWIVVFVVAGLVVWGIVRLVRRGRRSERSDDGASTTS